MDLISKGLNSVFGNKTTNISKYTRKQYTEGSIGAMTTANEAASLASNTETMDVDAVTAKLEANLNKITKYGNASSITSDMKASTASFLGGLAPSEYLKAWKGYVAARTSQVASSKSNPAQKQTFLTGGI